MNKRVFDSVARRWGYMAPARWTREQAERMCDHACITYADGAGYFAELIAQDRKPQAQRTALLKELRHLRAAQKVLKKSRKPSPAMLQAVEALNTAIRHIETDREHLGIFETLPRVTHSSRGRPAGGDGGQERARLLGDMSTVARLQGADTLTAQAKWVHALLKRNNVACGTVGTIRDSLRRLSNSRNRASRIN